MTDTATLSGCCIKCNAYTAAVEPWRQALVDAWEEQRQTLDELAEKTLLNRGTIHRILDNKTEDPGFNTVFRLAHAFGAEVAERIAASMVTTRPEESGHARQLGGDTSAGLDSLVARTLDAYRALADREDSAADSLEGDVLKAAAILNRAVQRIGRAEAPRRAAGEDER